MIQHAEFPGHSIRMREPEALCDASSKQYSGYLDVADDAHLFYWFFESRSKHPEKDPLVLWLNGGPGCSSTTGLLFELGPCAVANGGLNTTYNPYSWTESANVIFLDSPVQVGYSYGSKTVSNSQDTAEDIYAFLQLFYQKFPKFQHGDLQISGESYAGTYLPNIASTIHKHNLNKPTPNSLHLPLSSVLIGNGLTDACESLFTSVSSGFGPDSRSPPSSSTLSNMVRLPQTPSLPPSPSGRATRAATRTARSSTRTPAARSSPRLRPASA